MLYEFYETYDMFHQSKICWDIMCHLLWTWLTHQNGNGLFVLDPAEFDAFSKWIKGVGAIRPDAHSLTGVDGNTAHAQTPWNQPDLPQRIVKSDGRLWSDK